jgi:hypothetical protein
MERSTIFNGKLNYEWPFSIATLNYQRVEFVAGNRMDLFVLHPGCSSRGWFKGLP